MHFWLGWRVRGRRRDVRMSSLLLRDRTKSFPSYLSVRFPLHQPAMRQTLQLMEGIYSGAPTHGLLFICMDATGWKEVV